jgi:hypothetical protein
MTEKQNINEILHKVQSGELSAEDAALLLKPVASLAGQNFDPEKGERVEAASMSNTEEDGSSSIMEPITQRDANRDEATPKRIPQNELLKWQRWWMIPFWIGVVITIVGALLIFWGYSAARFSWGFWLAWIPFLLGLLSMVLAWQSQKGHWIHLRIRQKPGEKPGMIVISLPLPIGLAAWFIRTFGQFIPGLKDKHIDELLDAVRDSVSMDTPLYVNVDDKDGEHVEVFIG